MLPAFTQTSANNPLPANASEFQQWLQVDAAAKLKVTQYQHKDNLRIWVHTFEQQARSAGILPEVTVRVITQYLPVDMGNWLATKMRTQPLSWEDVKDLLFRRYAASVDTDNKLLLQRLRSVKQKAVTSIRDHASAFEYNLGLLLHPIPLQEQISIFVKSLHHSEIRISLLQKDFESLDAVIEDAIHLSVKGGLNNWDNQSSVTAPTPLIVPAVNQLQRRPNVEHRPQKLSPALQTEA